MTDCDGWEIGVQKIGKSADVVYGRPQSSSDAIEFIRMETLGVRKYVCTCIGAVDLTFTDVYELGS